MPGDCYQDSCRNGCVCPTPRRPSTVLAEVELAVQRRRAGGAQVHVVPDELAMRRALLIEMAATLVLGVEAIDDSVRKRRESLS